MAPRACCFVCGQRLRLPLLISIIGLLPPALDYSAPLLLLNSLFLLGIGSWCIAYCATPFIFISRLTSLHSLSQAFLTSRSDDSIWVLSLQSIFGAQADNKERNAVKIIRWFMVNMFIGPIWVSWRL